jgi:hypothetical protein
MNAIYPRDGMSFNELDVALHDDLDAVSNSALAREFHSEYQVPVHSLHNLGSLFAVILPGNQYVPGTMCLPTGAQRKEYHNSLADFCAGAGTRWRSHQPQP